ncbi:unnamed protein product [Ostreobium quekettii]|uniref:RRM domain-containing protein n=1 Tax=Ostreobium quekettii TaxID=121088 RepID=A0A8S1IQH5_9CHLO|nr:unnamed protein product [Ostreobium quekettii]
MACFCVRAKRCCCCCCCLSEFLPLCMALPRLAMSGLFLPQLDPVMQAAAGYQDTHDYQRMVPRTPPNDGTQGRLPAELSLQSPVDFMEGRPPRTGHRRAASVDVPTPPQMHERWTEPPARSPSAHRTPQDRQSYARALSQGQTHVHQGSGRVGAQGGAAARNSSPGPVQLTRAQSDRVDSAGAANSFGQGSPGLHRHRRRTASDTRFLQQQPLHGHGVFIARLPFGTEAAEVVNVMGEFGAIVGGVDGIQVRDGRNGCYAFVSYETEEAAEAAIRGPVKFGGKQVFIERKYSTVDGAAGAPSPGPNLARGRGRPGPGSRRTGSVG